MMLSISLINFWSDISFSQGSVATRLRYGGIFNNCFIANLLQIVTVKEFQKSVSIWWSYAWNTPDSLFPDTVYMHASYLFIYNTT